jgi:hypothetical protein
MANRHEIWEAIADDYSNANRPSAINPADICRYPDCIMSVLSDAQEEANRCNYGRSNDRINAAKVMLSRMRTAVRAAEEAARAHAQRSAEALVYQDEG